jgi:S-adenosylmethionine/arginine decarboxylase-like enzyme
MKVVFSSLSGFAGWDGNGSDEDLLTWLRLRDPDLDPWGLSLALDCFGCNAQIIRSSEAIQHFTRDLLTFIGMKAYGPCYVVRFAEHDPHIVGYSMMQLLETSSCTAHFSEYYQSAYIDLFSCAPYAPLATARFCGEWFQVQQVTIQALAFRDKNARGRA